MEFRKNRINIAEAKELDLVDYLASLGHISVNIKGNEHWYLSPFHGEKTPSFKVNRKKNRWFDFGGTKKSGGNLVDFGIAYHKCSVSDFLEQLSTGYTLQRPIRPNLEVAGEPEPKLTILSENPLTSKALFAYLHERGIDLSIAKRYCREVRFEIAGKQYYGIGFKNNQGGYEIRNQYMKSSSSPKVNTTFENGSKEVIVFEGFMDFLTFLTRNKHLPELRYNYAVLNGTALFNRARPFVESHQVARLYLDRGKGGENCTAFALSQNGIYKDESHLYKDHDDFNQWHMAQQKPARKRQSLRLK